MYKSHHLKIARQQYRTGQSKCRDFIAWHLKTTLTALIWILALNAAWQMGVAAEMPADFTLKHIGKKNIMKGQFVKR